VKSKSRWTLGGALIVAILALGPPTTRTIQIASSADGLLTLASFSDEDFDWNPWSQDCYLMHQDSAVWLLSDFKWPYDNRTDIFGGVEPMPLVNAALASRGRYGSEAYASVEDERLLLLIDIFMRKSESIEERWHGYTPVQAAILQEDFQAVKFLVERGANLNALINRPEKAMNGLNSFEFVELLYSKYPERFDAIRQYLRQLDNFA